MTLDEIKARVAVIAKQAEREGGVYVTPNGTVYAKYPHISKRQAERMRAKQRLAIS